MNAQPGLSRVKMTIGGLLLCVGLLGAITGDARMQLSGALGPHQFNFDPPPLAAAAIPCMAGLAVLGWAYVSRRNLLHQPPPLPPAVHHASPFQVDAASQKLPEIGMTAGTFLVLLSLWKMLGHHGGTLVTNFDGHAVIHDVSPAAVASVLCLAGTIIFIWSFVAYHASRRLTPPSSLSSRPLA